MFIKCKNSFRYSNMSIITIPKYNQSYLGYFVALVHVSGFIGMLTSYRDFFVDLTAINLIFSFLLIFWFHENKDRGFYIYTVLIIVIGFLIEVLGVNTGWPFGEYSYGIPFGPKILGTPPLIGLNWFVMTYCGALISKNITSNPWINALLAGLIITIVDIILEPVAINTGYWTWTAEIVPLQNYITWFVCISIFARIIYFCEKDRQGPNNVMVYWVFGSQLFFLISMMIYYTFR